MRTREEIYKAISSVSQVVARDEHGTPIAIRIDDSAKQSIETVTLEVLLDIRDLLGVMERKVDYIVEETD